VSYYIGIFFYIYCDITSEIYKSKGLDENSNPPIENFIDTQLSHMDSGGQRAIAMMYYAFTSLSTVGFGDLSPKNDAERIYVSILLFVGVIIFSYILGCFTGILDTFKDVDAEMEDGEGLSQFFGLIKHYNKGRFLDQDIKEKIEDFMEYRWLNDKNQAVSDDKDRELISQLPLEIEQQIYSNFMFKNFLKNFSRYFSIENRKSPQCHSYYTWENSEYQGFMIQLLQFLEPIQFLAKQTIYNELDDVNEVIFVKTGMYDVGYEINKKVSLKLRMPNKTVIGGF